MDQVLASPTVNAGASLAAAASPSTIGVLAGEVIELLFQLIQRE